jgi:hypothetical protein
MVKLNEEKIKEHIQRRNAMITRASNAICKTGPSCGAPPPLQGPKGQVGGGNPTGQPSPTLNGGPPGPSR